MSIHYLLDGYNIIPQMNTSKHADLEGQRLYLIKFVEQNSPQGSSNNRVTIVFDGREDIFGGMTSHAAKIVFSRGESADDAIKKLVAASNNAKNIVVVSDDRSVQYAVGALGAKAIGVRAFLEKSKTAKQKKRPAKTKKVKSPAGKKYISKTDESKITNEMGEIWLKSDE